MEMPEELKHMIKCIAKNNQVSQMGDDDLHVYEKQGEILKDEKSGIDTPFMRKNHFQLVVRNILSILSTLGALLYIILDRLQIF